MTYNEAIEWMDSRHWSGTGKGIVRSQELLERLGNPQDKLKFVHVAGTNGKGSVCACLSKILTAAGYQVGLFVSPHLKDVYKRQHVFSLPDGTFAASFLS